MKLPFTIPKMKLSKLETFLLVVFVVYILFPISTPASMAGAVSSPLNMLVMFLITVYLFLYVSPILGVLYIFVVYELIRRSSVVATSTYRPIINYTPTSLNSIQRDQTIKSMNKPVASTLEEEMVQTHAPVGVSESGGRVDVSFKPVSENIHNAFSL
jgi:phosphate/sulfate permease